MYLKFKVMYRKITPTWFSVELGISHVCNISQLQLVEEIVFFCGFGIED